MPAFHRRRIHYSLAAVIVVLLGLATRRFPQFVPAVLDKYPGDALWTVLVFVLWGIIFPRATSLRIASLALVTSLVVEFGQLYRAPWIMAIRKTTIGHLVLGNSFAWGDLVAYTIGASVALTIESFLFRCLRDKSP